MDSLNHQRQSGLYFDDEASDAPPRYVPYVPNNTSARQRPITWAIGTAVPFAPEESPISPLASPVYESRYETSRYDSQESLQNIPSYYERNDSEDTLRPIIRPEPARRKTVRSWRGRSSQRRTRIEDAIAKEIPEEPKSHVKGAEDSASSVDTVGEQKAPDVTYNKGANIRPWHQRLNPLKWSEIPAVPQQREVCPEFTANQFSKITFGWMTPLMATGYRRKLEKNDIWKVNSDREVNRLSEPFHSAFQRRREAQSKRPLLMALYDAFKKDFWLGGICLLVSSLGQVMVPFTLRFLLSFSSDAYNAAVSHKDGPPISRGLGILFGIVFIQLVQSLTTNQFLYHGAMVGAQSRAVLTTAIFEKSLRISGRARAIGDGYSDGKIMNLMATDVTRIDLAASMLHMIWASPLTILACLVLLIINITYSAVAGFSLLVLSIPALTFATKSLAVRRKAISAISDSRVSLVSEVLKSIRFVKYNAWETSFLNKLKVFRKKETKLVAKLLTTRNAIYVISISTPVFAAMISFIVYSMTGHSLGVGPVFSSLALFNAVRIPLSLLPIVIGQMADAMACLKRIEDFFMAEEHQEDIVWSMDAKEGITVKDASFVWEKSTHSDKDAKSVVKSGATKDSEVEIKMEALSTGPFSLNNLDFSVGRNELIAVIGSVGSGKTSLLSALAGEMRKTSGTITMGSWSRAYCPQQAWIQNATVKQNILFGKNLDACWYEQVKEACCLQADITQLSAGEDTEIGERGINLSGGQRQRINLARAIYSESDIVLLDDPLSAVDVHVGRHLFDRAICGLLGDKCRILATHQLHILKRCDRILWLDGGKVKKLDTFDNLIKDDAEFREMMANTRQEDASESEEKKSTQGDTSKSTAQTFDPAPKNQKSGQLVKEEAKGEGHVPWSVYRAYIQSSGHVLLGLIPVVLLLLAQAANAIMGLWLGFWASNRFHLTRNNYIAIYVGLAFSQALLMFAFTASISNLGSISSRRVLDAATEKVVRSPQSFHDAQPLGRIINRLSRDADVVDNQLPDALRMFLYTMVVIITVVAMLIYYFPYFAIALVPIIALFLFATTYFRVTARQLKRHEAVLRGALSARFSESVSGVLTIRAFGLQTHFTAVVREAIDNMNSVYYLTNASQRWLATRLDVVANTMVLVVGLLVVAKRDTIHPSISGVLLAYLLSMIHVIQLVVRQLAEVQTGMTSMERLHEYATSLDTEIEEPASVILPARSWPEKGAIEMRDVSMRYNVDLPLVINNLDLSIRGGEKLAIVGRTGAGKSSITQILFRLVDLAGGSVAIDGIDIAQVPLSILRSKIAIITQDPTLFKGTVRTNLDPFDEYTDLELWDALRRVGVLDEGKVKLESGVEEGGVNFSLGQRQLLALSRALLQNAQIVICDEATSSVDSATDTHVQQVIREAFANKSVITIAHRLKTIIDYDRVCVLDQGSVKELGAPLELWQQSGVFAEMCRSNGIQRGDFRGIPLFEGGCFASI